MQRDIERQQQECLMVLKESASRFDSEKIPQYISIIEELVADGNVFMQICWTWLAKLIKSRKVYVAKIEMELAKTVDSMRRAAV